MAKTLKLKKPEPTLTAKPVPAPGAEPAAAPVAPTAGEPPQQEGGIYVASRHRNPMEAAENAPVKKEKWTWAAILAIFSTLLFLVLCVLEYMDMEELSIA